VAKERKHFAGTHAENDTVDCLFVEFGGFERVFAENFDQPVNLNFAISKRSIFKTRISALLGGL